MRNPSPRNPCSAPPVTLCALALALALTLAFPLHAQNAKAGAKNNGAKNSGDEIKAAQKPKSDKWKLSFLPVGLQKNPQTDFTIITEKTDEGRKLPEPSFDKPVYYISHSIGQRDVGGSYAGTHPIEYKYLENQLNKALASNGYRIADPGHSATQVLFIAWGMHNRIVEPETGGDDIGEGSVMTDDGEVADIGGDSMVQSYTVDMNDIKNLLSRAKVIGGKKFADEFALAVSDQLAWTNDLRARGPLRTFAERNDITESLVDQVFEDCYYLLVTAMDFEALKHNERKILWTTKISTTARGLDFAATMPNMIENAAYYFGREMTVPDIVTKRSQKKGTVTIGEATVEEYYMTGTTVPSGTTPPKN